MRATPRCLRQHTEEQRREAGFTFLAILIVIVVLGILAATAVLAVPHVNGNSASTRSSSRAGAQTACAADFMATQTAVQSFVAQMGFYPSGLPANWSSAPGIVASRYPADGTTAATKYTSAMAELKGTVTTPAPISDTSGPWLKDTPQNNGHYSIVVSYDGKGAITVLNPAGAATSCSSIN